PSFMHAIKSPLVDPPKLALLNLNENFADPESPQVSATISTDRPILEILHRGSVSTPPRVGPGEEDLDDHSVRSKQIAREPRALDARGNRHSLPACANSAVHGEPR